MGLPTGTKVELHCQQEEWMPKDTATNTVTATIPTGNGPTTVAFQKRIPIGSLIAQVQALVGGGILTQNEADNLIKKLEGTQAKLDKGQSGAVCGQLGSFINQVNAFINNGSLTSPLCSQNGQ